MNIKTFKRRDSATAALRKLGVPAVHYNRFILLNEDGSVTVNVTAAVDFISDMREQKVGARLRKVNKTATAPAKQAAPARRTAAAVARELILKGKTNEQIWVALKTEFNLDDGKRGYPAWYRMDCRRKGLIK